MSILPRLARFATVSIAWYFGDVIDILLEAEETAPLEEFATQLGIHRIAIIEAQLQRCRGLLHRRDGELVDAEMALSQSVELLRSAANPYALATTLLDRGSLLVDLGRPTEATEALREARSLFEGLRATPWIERTDRALAPLVAV